MLFVKQQLHDPASAEWIEMDRWTVIDNKDGSYSVGARYRARTVAGGLKLSYTTCVLRQDGSNWTLLSLARMY